MIHAFRSEWRKLLRRGQILGTWGTMVGFALLLAILIFSRAVTQIDPTTVSEDRGSSILISTLEKADGWVVPFEAAGALLGIISLVTAAGNMATEYTSGTLKVLLVREPRRPVFLGGKILALWSFQSLGILIAFAASVLMSLAIGGGRGFDLSAWNTANGWAHLFDAWFNVTVAAFVWSLLGIMLAVLLRNGPAAIGIGIALPIMVEPLLGLALPQVAKWMPGTVLGAVVQGAKDTVASGSISYWAAIGMMLLYGITFLGVGGYSLWRRDVV